MKNNDLKKIAQELLKKSGRTKGSELLTLQKYIKVKYGKEGLEKLEKKLKEIGCPIKFDEIKPAHWYPESFSVIALITAKEIFQWPDLFEFGYYSPNFSFGVKVFIKFLPLPLFLKEAKKNWKKFLDVGELEIAQYDEKKKFIILSIKNYDFHPAMCRYYEGFFLKLAECVIPGKKIKITEKKCIHKGDPHHEFLVTWE